MRFEKFYIKDLSEVVHSITVIGEDAVNDLCRKSSRFYADGLPGIMLVRSEKSPVLGCGKKLEQLFFYGQTVNPVDIVTTGSYEAIIVHLFPHSTKQILGINAVELTDTCLGFSDWGTGKEKDRLNGMLKNADTWACIRFLTQIIHARMNAYGIDFSIRAATELITVSKGEIDLKTLHQTVNMSERSLQRKFREYVGTTPNVFRRIQKFQYVMNGLNSGTYENLTDLAYDHGFADQSHFIRVFKQFTGTTPGEYLESLNAGLPL